MLHRVVGKSGRGRKPKDKGEFIELCKAKLNEVCKGIKVGLTFNDACRAAGIDVSTFYRWKDMGKTDPDFDFFNEPIEQARAQGQLLLANRIEGHSKKDWRAAAWILERRHPAVWGNNRQMTLDDEDVLEENRIKEMTPDELRSELRKLRATASELMKSETEVVELEAKVEDGIKKLTDPTARS